MSAMNQWVAVLGLAIIGGAGCDANEGSATSRLDDETAAEMDRKHKDKDKEQPSDGPNICYSVSRSFGSPSGFVRLDMTAETITPVPNLPGQPQGEITALGHFGGALVACQGWPGPSELVIYDLDGSDVKTLPISCQAVTGDGDRLWVMESLSDPAAQLREFRSFSQLVANTPARTFPTPSAFSLGTSAYNRLVAAWHSTNEVILIDLEDGTESVSPLQGYDAWIFGSHETADHRYMVGGWTDEDRGIHVFDPQTGAAQGRLFADQMLAGLTCDVQ